MLLLMTTGCSATYDLYIGEKLTDNILLYDDTDLLEGLDYYDMNDDTELNINNYSYQVSLFEKDFVYPKEKYSTDRISGYIYNYTYNYDKMNEKSMIVDCYDDISIERDDDIIIRTSNEFKCFDEYSLLDDVTINIHYSGKLISTNADSYKDGVYTWKINKNNYADSMIYLKVEKNKQSYTFDIIGGVVFGVLIVVSAVVLYLHNRKIKNS